MKILYRFFFISFLAFSFGQNKEIIIHGVKFNIKTIENESEQTTSYELYRGDKKLVTHTKFYFDGDCSSEIVELGTYTIDETTIHFYTYWASGDRMGKFIYPYGFRKQTYIVNEYGTLHLKDSELYIESFIDSYLVHSGMKYLKESPKTEEEKELLKQYVQRAEEMYKAKFVLEEQKERLEKEVRLTLQSEIEEATNYWDELYGGNVNK